jgi:hypothetical protein
VFVSFKPFQPALIFASKAGAYKSGANNGAPLYLKNEKKLVGDSLAYFASSSKETSFMTL